MQRRPESRKATMRGWIVAIVLLAAFIVSVLFLYYPASATPADKKFANIVFESGKYHIFVQNEGGKPGSIVVARKVTVYYADGTRSTYRLPQMMVSLRPGEREKLHFPPRPRGIKRMCKSAGEAGVGSEAVVCIPEVRRR